MKHPDPGISNCLNELRKAQEDYKLRTGIDSVVFFIETGDEKRKGIKLMVITGQEDPIPVSRALKKIQERRSRRRQT